MNRYQVVLRHEQTGTLKTMCTEPVASLASIRLGLRTLMELGWRIVRLRKEGIA